MAIVLLLSRDKPFLLACASLFSGLVLTKILSKTISVNQMLLNLITIGRSP